MNGQCAFEAKRRREMLPRKELSKTTREVIIPLVLVAVIMAIGIMFFGYIMLFHPDILG